jgi:hypothetical protein
MPNGGSDCCGTCWFNAPNKGEVGLVHPKGPEPSFCTIRGLAIDNPYYTYCVNHPHRCPDRDPIPIGAVLVARGEFDKREVWQPSPDTEEVRLHLLELVRDIEEQPTEEYPAGGMYRDEMVVWQLGCFREERAVPDLKRIAAFSPDAAVGAFRKRANLVAVAKVALSKIGEGVA